MKTKYLENKKCCTKLHKPEKYFCIDLITNKLYLKIPK